MLTEEILSGAKALQDEMVRIRRLLHQHPELAFQEQQTARIIRSALDGWGVPYRAAGTGTLVDIGQGPAEGLALRADIDALPIQEQTGLPYSSLNPGRMHACGHDCHAAMLLGTARLLWACRDTLPGPIRLIFQPAEEGGGGALSMIEAGALEGMGSIYCLHMQARRPIATFATRKGYIHAASDGYEITIHGKSCHGASPQGGVDALHIAAHTILALEGILAREISAYDQAVMTIGKIQGGTARNILCGEVCLEGTLRTLGEELRAQIHQRMRQVIEGTATMARGSAELTFVQRYCACRNDERATALAAATAERLFGPGAVEWLARPSMGGEDFGFYQQQIPGAKLYIGTGREEDIHTPFFQVNEDGLYAGAALLAAIAFSRSNATQEEDRA